MFESEPQWEPIDPLEASAPPWPSAVAAKTTAKATAKTTGAAGAGPSSAPAMPGTEPADAIHVEGPDAADDDDDDNRHLDAGGQPASPAADPTDPLGIRNATMAHDKPFETDVSKSKQKHFKSPHQGAYNVKVHNDRESGTTFGRPGIVVGKHHGLFQLKHDAVRYTFTNQGNENVAVPFDKVFAKDLFSVNYRAHHLTPAQRKQLHKEQHPKHGKKKTDRLALNPAPPTPLQIKRGSNIEHPLCVLSWLSGHGNGAAWLPVDDLKGSRSAILSQVTKEAKHDDPAHKLHNSVQYLIREPDAIGGADGADKKNKGRVYRPGHAGGDNVSHYLVHNQKKQTFDADGNVTGRDYKQFVAICMNLPAGGVPPVAVDTALPNQPFFAFTEPKFHQEVSVYEHGHSKVAIRQKWVFGHLGKTTGDPNNPVAPDEKRAGWVPLRVLKLP